MMISQGCFELLCITLLSSSFIKPPELHKRTLGLLTATFASLHPPIRSGYLTGGYTAPGSVPLTPKLAPLDVAHFAISHTRQPLSKKCVIQSRKNMFYCRNQSHVSLQ